MQKLLWLSFVVVIQLCSVFAQNSNTPDLRKFLKLKQIIQTGDERLQFVVFVPESDLILTSAAVSNKQANFLKFWNFKTGQLAAKIAPCDGRGSGGRWFSSDGNLIAVGCYYTPTGELWKIKTAQRLETFQTKSRGDNNLTFTILSPNGANVLVNNNHYEQAELWSTETGAKIAALNPYLTKGLRDLYSAQFSPDSETIAVSYNADVYLWDAQTGKMLNFLIDTAPNLKTAEGQSERAHRSIIWELLFSPDSSTLITGSYDTTAKSWDVKTGKLLQTFEGHKAKITALAISSNGLVLATGSLDQKVKLWDLKSGQLRWTSPAHKHEIWKMFFSPDGSKLLTMTNKKMFMWETASGKLIGEMPSVFWQTFFSPDWHYLVTPGKEKGTVELYEFQF